MTQEVTMPEWDPSITDDLYDATKRYRCTSPRSAFSDFSIDSLESRFSTLLTHSWPVS